MIPVKRLREMLLELRSEVNSSSEVEKLIEHIIVSPTEKHLTNKLKDKSDLILAVKMPDSDTDAINADNYGEVNHNLFYLVEKVDPGKMTDNDELNHFSAIQKTMTLVKEWLFKRGLNGNVCGGDETVSKPFRTEWEYQTFGGFNGLSISFDLKDFSL